MLNYQFLKLLIFIKIHNLYLFLDALRRKQTYHPDSDFSHIKSSYKKQSLS